MIRRWVVSVALPATMPSPPVVIESPASSLGPRSPGPALCSQTSQRDRRGLSRICQSDQRLAHQMCGLADKQTRRQAKET